jgi:23S rRNA (uracil1939-C5)-methyltransferase
MPKPEIMGMEEPWRYRNKAQFPFGTDKDGHVVTGFYAARTHSIIPCTECWLGVEENQVILEKILAHMERYHIPAYDEKTQKGYLRHVLIRKGFTSGELMVCLIVNGRNFPKMDCLTEELIRVPGMTSITINVNTKNTNVIMGTEMIPVWGQDYITDSIGNVKYQISPLSFYQVNPVQTKKLYETALEYADLQGSETVWDLYCGIGTISLFLAQKAGKVYGVEIVPEAIEDAKRNARLNGYENAEFFVGKAEEVLPQKYRDESIYADVIVVDPPRKGCDPAALETMVKMQPKRIVYVSCDSATLARDLRYLCAEGYQVDKVKACDMFPGTVHVESVVLLTQNLA